MAFLNKISREINIVILRTTHCIILLSVSQLFFRSRHKKKKINLKNWWHTLRTFPRHPSVLHFGIIDQALSWLFESNIFCDVMCLGQFFSHLKTIFLSSTFVGGSFIIIFSSIQHFLLLYLFGFCFTHFLSILEWCGYFLFTFSIITIVRPIFSNLDW